LTTALLLIGILATGAEAQVYHWVDDQGVIHYTTGIESVPERFRPAARALPVSTADPPSEPSAASRSGTTTIPFTAGAPILVSARINGTGPVTLILDTGAERTVVTPAALAQLGISTPTTSRALIRGVTGSSVADVVWVESLEVGGARAGPLAIIAHDAGLPHAEGLLGRDFLSLFSVTIDAHASVVTLEPN
jgi:predicted aspartyl protease